MHPTFYSLVIFKQDVVLVLGAGWFPEHHVPGLTSSLDPAVNTTEAAGSQDKLQSSLILSLQANCCYTERIEAALYPMLTSSGVHISATVCPGMSRMKLSNSQAAKVCAVCTCQLSRSDKQQPEPGSLESAWGELSHLWDMEPGQEQVFRHLSEQAVQGNQGPS